mmetsp:Transcript_1524/g.2267  ORF Transcript_1524/g.2267 Transcript_1524/m.2267 type:complete len:112 (+) Transcript_1524:1117-1452(+)
MNRIPNNQDVHFKDKLLPLLVKNVSLEKKKKKSQKQNTKFLHQNNSVTDSCATEVELEDHSNEVENMSDVVSSSSYSKKRKSDSAQLDAPNKSLRTRKTRTSMAATAAACT